MKDLWCLILILVVFGMGSLFGATLSDITIYRLKQENQSLRRMLDDMRRMDELAFKTYCAMFREVAYSRQQPHTKTLPPKK